jgi:peptide/nickel transport system permease protein
LATTSATGSGVARSAPLAAFVLRRFFHAIPLIFAVIVINFTLIHLAPGDPIHALVGEYELSQEQMSRLREEMGLDRPLYIQLVRYITSVLKGNLGYSYILQQPVLDLILDRLPATVLLVLTALILYSLIGVFLGVLSSRRPYSLGDNLGTIAALMGYSMPIFWLGQMLLLVFALWLQWLPSQGIASIRESADGMGRLLDVAKHLVLPATALGMRYLALNARLTRASMLEALGQDYIVAARAKGLNEAQVMGHALRNAMLPVVTIFGVNIGFIMAGSVLTEIVFGWPGMGLQMYDGIYARDYPLLMGMFIFISIGIIVANLITDIVYGALDPRIRQA